MISSAREEQNEKQVVSAMPVSKRKRLRKPDTNVLSIRFNRLLLPGNSFFFSFVFHKLIHRIIHRRNACG